VVKASIGNCEAVLPSQEDREKNEEPVIGGSKCRLPSYRSSLTHSGPSCSGLLTHRLTGYASVSSDGYGVSHGRSCAGSWIVGSSQRASASRVGIKGVRSWIGSTTRWT